MTSGMRGLNPLVEVAGRTHALNQWEHQMPRQGRGSKQTLKDGVDGCSDRTKQYANEIASGGKQ
jgi:hypothetical protein